jgi:hypothetical protein
MLASLAIDLIRSQLIAGVRPHSISKKQRLMRVLRVLWAVISGLAIACMPIRSPTNGMFWLTMLSIPPNDIGHCTKGPYEGGIFRISPPGTIKVSLHIGDPGGRGRDISVLIDSTGRTYNYGDEVSFPRDDGVMTLLSIGAQFDSLGQVVSGMQHHHEMSRNSSAIVADSALSMSKYAQVAAAAVAIRERCGA